MKNAKRGKIILVYVTCTDAREAEALAKNLLRKRLIGCANIFPMRSLYRWKRKLVKGREAVLIAKTRSANYQKVRKEVMGMHSYDIPCIIKINAVPNREYANWLHGEMA